MKVSLLNESIEIQRKQFTSDKYGNRITNYVGFANVHAIISGESPKEMIGSTAVYDDSRMDFTIRYSKDVKDIDSTGYRVLFKGKTYDIEGVDHMNYKKKMMKLICRRNDG